MRTVLLIEDDNDVNHLLVDIFDNEGFNVLSAKNGKEGLEIINKIKPDIIICDINMPFMNGMEFFKIIQSDENTSDIPFIFLTAKSSMEDLREGMGLGADDYITKPFRINDLLKTVNIRLKKKENTAALIEDMKEALIKKVPHELRTPLVGILGFSELIETDIENLSKEEIQNMANRISYSGRRLHRRIEKFLIYAELMSRYDKKIVKTISPVRIIQSNYSDTVEKLSSELEITRPLKLTMAEENVLIEERYYDSLFRELVENAYKFSTDDVSPVSIKGEADNEFYKTTVINRGKQLTAEEINQIGLMNMFSSERNSVEGNGLGLAIVKKIIQIFNGYIKVESKPDSTTSFEVGIPLVKRAIGNTDIAAAGTLNC